MTRSNRIAAVLGFVLLGLVALLGVLYSVVDRGIGAAVDNKSAKTTTATIVSTGAVGEQQSGSSESHRICFTIDSLDQVAPAWRPGYEAAERQREGKSGPRCKVTDNAAAARLRVGDKLQITYLLANDDRIEIVGIKDAGVDFGSEGTSYYGSGTVRR